MRLTSRLSIIGSLSLLACGSGTGGGGSGGSGGTAGGGPAGGGGSGGALPVEICDNGTDDDGDNDVDCDDEDCAPGDPAEPAAMAGITRAHNVVRCGIAPPSGGRLSPLVWSADAATFAQTWADQMLSEGCSNIRHSDGPYGENLMWGTGTYTPDVPVTLWVEDEETCFSFNTFPACCSCTCGHYTQVVWRDSQAIGCAMANCPGLEFWVCEYDPPGNFIGRYPY